MTDAKRALKSPFLDHKLIGIDRVTLMWSGLAFVPMIKASSH